MIILTGKVTGISDVDENTLTKKQTNKIWTTGKKVLINKAHCSFLKRLTIVSVHFYRPPTKLLECNVFTDGWLLFCSGGWGVPCDNYHDAFDLSAQSPQIIWILDLLLLASCGQDWGSIQICLHEDPLPQRWHQLANREAGMVGTNGQYATYWNVSLLQ